MNVGKVITIIVWSHIILLVFLTSLAYVFRAPVVEFLHTMLSGTAVLEETAEAVLLSDTDTSVTGAIARANPAVVSVIVTKDVPILEQYYEQFGFFQIPRVRERGTEEREVGGGSGFIVSSDGLVVTNRHVVDDPDASYSILMNDGSSHEVTVVARDAVLDVAVLQIEGNGTYPSLTFGDSDALVLGQSVIAIGNALAEFRNSVSVGVVSGLSRSIIAGGQIGMAEVLDEVIQTDAAINPGNSGGPLLDLAGNVIGVNVATALGSENIGFALPGNAVARVVESIETHGRIIRPFIGVRYRTVTPAVAAQNDLPVEYGALVTAPNAAAVVPDSPADQVGIVPGDIILSIDGEVLRDGKTLASVIRRKAVGKEVTLRILRNGVEIEVSLVLAEAPAQ